jgi:putative hydrolase of the HAD superfamily
LGVQRNDNVPVSGLHEQGMQHIRAITLDLDDTLWPIGPVIRRAELALRAWLEQHVPAVAQKHPPESVARIRKRVVREHPEMAHDLTFIRRQVLARMGHGAGVGDAFVDDAFAAFDAARNRVELYPEVGVTLTSLATRYPLVAVTNGNARLDAIGIAHHFEACISAREIGKAKPHRDIFAAATRAGGASPAETLHVGDHPEQDVHGAKEAGLHAVWVNRQNAYFPGVWQQPDRTVATLEELDAWLKSHDE